MKTRLVNMGNSRGIRLPKPIIEQVGIVGEVDLRVENGVILVTPLRARRAGWGEKAAQLAASESPELLDPPLPTRFDEDEWQW